MRSDFREGILNGEAVFFAEDVRLAMFDKFVRPANSFNGNC